MELVGEINEDSAVKPTPAEIIDINGNTGGVADKSEEEMRATQNGVHQAEEEEGEGISASTASGEEESNVEEQDVVEDVIVHETESSVSIQDLTEQSVTLQATEETVQETQETECAEETIQCLEEETEALVALEVAVSGETSENFSLEANSSFSEENSSSLETNCSSLEVNSSSTESNSSFSAVNSQCAFRQLVSQIVFVTARIRSLFSILSVRTMLLM